MIQPMSLWNEAKVHARYPNPSHSDPVIARAARWRSAENDVVYGLLDIALTFGTRLGSTLFLRSFACHSCCTNNSPQRRNVAAAAAAAAAADAARGETRRMRRSGSSRIGSGGFAFVPSSSGSGMDCYAATSVETAISVVLWIPVRLRSGEEEG